MAGNFGGIRIVSQSLAYSLAGVTVDSLCEVFVGGDPPLRNALACPVDFFSEGAFVVEHHNIDTQPMNNVRKRTRERKLFGWVMLMLMLISVGGYLGCSTKMPGRSFSGEIPEITETQIFVQEELRRVVTTLAVEHINRHTGNPEKLDGAANYVQSEFEDLGYAVTRQSYEVNGVACHNLIAEIKGSDEIMILGAHYDAVPNCPAANDNASGVAALIAMARHFAGKTPGKTIRFVAFTNEEPPHFRQPSMGSLIYAKHCRANDDNIVAMFSLETMGYYSEEKNSQNYPPVIGWLYPSTGDFVGIVGNKKSRALARETVRLFREHAKFPSEGAALPDAIEGVGFSDHWSFWKYDYPGLMITDTAYFRYAHYHLPSDTPDKLNFPHYARVVDGLQDVFFELAK